VVRRIIAVILAAVAMNIVLSGLAVRLGLPKL
jgi:hypothetical protein